jgi:hypothetical protein
LLNFIFNIVAQKSRTLSDASLVAGAVLARQPDILPNFRFSMATF